MIKEFTGTGKTIQEATINARQGLNAPLGADIQVEVVCEPRKKILGLFGGSDAKVRAYYDDGKKERKPHQKKQNQNRNQNSQQKEKRQQPQKDGKKETAPAKQQPRQKREKPQAEKSAPAPKEKPASNVKAEDIDLDYACNYLKAMLSGMKVDDAEVTAEVVDGVVEMTVKAADYGIIIGRRGETLDALQYLTGLAIKNVTEKYVRVSINVGDYKEKRAETLRALAAKNANYVLRSGRRYTFEPMNPYERRIIHTTVQEIEGVTSRSIGNGIDRRVVLEPEGGVRHRSSYRNDRRQRSSAPVQTDPNREKKVDRADIPKFGKIQVNNSDDE